MHHHNAKGCLQGTTSWRLCAGFPVGVIKRIRCLLCESLPIAESRSPVSSGTLHPEAWLLFPSNAVDDFAVLHLVLPRVILFRSNVGRGDANMSLVGLQAGDLGVRRGLHFPELWP